MGSPTIRYGLIGGILLIAEMLVVAALSSLGVLQVSITAGQQPSNAETATLLALGIVTLALYLGTPFVGGLLAAKGTGFAKSGAWAGTLAMFISGLAIVVALFLTPLDFSNVQGVGAYIPSSADTLRIHALVALIGGGAIVIGRVIFGAILGALGGLIGRMFYREPRSRYDYGESAYEIYLPLTLPGNLTRDAATHERYDPWQNRRYFVAPSPGQRFDNWPAQSPTYR